MKYDILASDAALADFCREASTAPSIAFDTEFVSEDSYRPDLCLIQAATPTSFVVVDVLAIKDVSPFWRLLSQGGHETIVHSGREEFLFCRQACESRPVSLFDTQIAAAFLGLEYPAAYSTLVNRLLGQNVHKGETRTNWRQRPLSKLQLDYAMQDVVHLLPLRDLMRYELETLGRSQWLAEEMLAWQTELEESEQRERWRRLPGLASLSPRALAIVRSMWNWRDQEAQQRDCPARRVLRDDLLVELSRRQSDDVRQIRAVRGMERGDLQRRLPDIGQAIATALALPMDQCPPESPKNPNRTGDLLAQFLAVALSSICRRSQLAPGLVGTIQDLKDLVSFRMHKRKPVVDVPALAQGWRAEVVGRLIDDLLAGSVSVRVEDMRADNPLVIEPSSSPRGSDRS